MKNTILTTISLLVLVGLAASIVIFQSPAENTVDTPVEIEESEDTSDNTVDRTPVQDEQPKKKYGSRHSSSTSNSDSTPSIPNVEVKTKIIGELDVDKYIYEIAIDIENLGSRADNVQVYVNSDSSPNKPIYHDLNVFENLGLGESSVIRATIEIPYELLNEEKPTFEVTVTGSNFDSKTINAPVNIMLPAKTEVSLRSKVIEEKLDEETYLYTVAVEVTNPGYVPAEDLVFNLESDSENTRIKYADEQNTLDSLEREGVHVFVAYVEVKPNPQGEEVNISITISGKNFTEESLEATFDFAPVELVDIPEVPENPKDDTQFSSE